MTSTSSRKRSISPLTALVIFGSATAYFYALLFTLLPFTKEHFSVNPALYWLITGFFLFVPLFCFAAARAAKEGDASFRQVLDALNIRPLSKRDWKYAVIGPLLTFLFTGVVFGGSFLLTALWGVRALTTTPWFMEMQPFRGVERLMLIPIIIIIPDIFHKTKNTTIGIFIHGLYNGPTFVAVALGFLH